MPRRTLRLVERRPRDVRLRRAEVDHLLAAHAGRIDVAPTRRRGVWRLTALGWVGAAESAALRVEVRPKLPGANLLALLGVPAAGDAEGGPADDLPALLAGRLAELLDDRLAAGLARGYVETPGDGRYLRGRLDVPALLRDAARRDRLPHVADELTDDIAVNRFVRAAATAAARFPGLPAAARHRLDAALAAMPGVADVPLAVPDALAVPDGYGPLVEACRWLALGLGTATPAGGAGLWLDIDAVFERYVTRAVAAAFAGDAVRVQPTYPIAGQELRPDVVVEAGGRPALVVDAKWKRDRAARPADVYQAVAYAAALGAPRAVLVYPAACSRSRAAAFGAGPVLEVRSLAVTGPAARLAAAAARLGRALRAGPCVG